LGVLGPKKMTKGLEVGKRIMIKDDKKSGKNKKSLFKPT
jgi:hypothetical protein